MIDSGSPSTAERYAACMAVWEEQEARVRQLTADEPEWIGAVLSVIWAGIEPETADLSTHQWRSLMNGLLVTLKDDVFVAALRDAPRPD